MDELLSWFRECNIPIENPILDGKNHRFFPVGDKKPNGKYIGSITPSGIPTCTVTNFKTGEQLTFRSKKVDSLTNEKREQYLSDLKEVERVQKLNQEVLQRKIAEKAKWLWRHTTEVPLDNKYLQSKKLKASYGAKYSRGNIVVPVYSFQNEISSLQFIFEDGGKRFLRDGKTTGCYFKIGKENPECNHPIAITEGFATGVTIHEATGYTVYVCFSAYNIQPVSVGVRSKYPTAEIIIYADNDWMTEVPVKNPGVTFAVAAAREIQGKMTAPSFHPDDLELEPTDFNDLYCLRGMDEVKKQIAKLNEKCGATARSVVDKPQSQSKSVSESTNADRGSAQSKASEENKFPVDALGEMFACTVSKIAQDVSAPEEIVCSSLLAASALVVQSHYNIKAFGSVRPISLNFVTIAESGERKSTVDRIVLSELYKWREEKDKIYKKELERYKLEFEEWKNTKDVNKRGSKPKSPKAPMLFVSEPTVEGLFHCLKYHRGSVGLFADEGGAFVGGHSMRTENIKATLGKLNQLWDGSPIDRVRKGKDEGEIDILYGKRVSAHLMMQTKIAHELYSNEYAKSQGFLARCLTCEPKSMIGERKFMFNIPVPKEMGAFNQRVRYFLDLKTEEDEKKVIDFSEEALRLMRVFYYEIEAQLKPGGKYSSVKDFASKLIEHCIRIAAVLEVFHSPASLSVRGEMMEGAIQIGKFYLDEQLKITGNAMVFPSKDCEALYYFLCKKESWKLRDVQLGCSNRLRKKDVLVQLLVKLDECGFCKFDQSKKEITL